MTDSAKIRDALIEAVGIHEGWEESAVALVDEAIMPIISARLTLPNEDEAVKTIATYMRHVDYQEENYLALARATYAALKKLAEEQR